MDERQPPHRSHLFTLRLWLEELGAGQTEWRGKVQHALSGQTRYFREWPALIAHLQAMLTKLAVEDPDESILAPSTDQISETTKGGTPMSARILQINFKFNVTGAEYEQAVSPLADDIAAVPGLRWKIWIINEAESEAGGIFLFDGEPAVRGFLEGPIAAQITGHPALSDFGVKQFDVMEQQTAITRGPVE